MFSDKKPLNEAQFREIRSFGNTAVGQSLSDYLMAEVQGYVNGMLRVDASDVAQIAYSQGGAEIAKRVWGLLNYDIETILAEHNIEPEEL